MRVLKLAFVGLLIGAAPIDVPIGRFQAWRSFEKKPVTFTSAGVSVRVEALPCPAQPDGDSSCRREGYNNLAAVTVSAPGVAPLSLMTDRQSAYVRIAVVRFRESDFRPGIIIESQYGGSGGDMTAQLVMPSGNGYRVLPMDLPHGPRLQGEIADAPRDLSGDGRIDLKLEDGSFESVFGCNACTPRPPSLFTVKDGKLVDESRDPVLRIVFRDRYGAAGTDLPVEDALS